MFANNPYAQAGWHNPQNPHSINGGPWRPNANHPPTFGVLPPTDTKPSSTHIFDFMLNPDIYTSLVMGPKKMKYFEVRTSAGSTMISKPGEQFAVVNWSQHPTIEARGFLARQRTGEFLKLSSDRTHRTMVIGGRTYAWIPRESGIYLYSIGPSPPVEFARLTMSSDNSKIRLEITSDAFQASLFEPCIISTVLLFSGRNIN